MLQVGDTVKLPQGYTGTLRWLGRIEGSAIEYAGIELDEQFAMHGKHSGVFNQKQYFETQLEQSGIFVSFSKLISSNVHSPQYETHSTISLDSDPRSSSRLARRSTDIGLDARPNSLTGSESDLFAALQQAEEEIAKLRATILDKEGRITSLRETMDQRQQEFRETIDFFEEQSKTLDHDYNILVQQLEEQKSSSRLGVNEDHSSSNISISRLADDPVNQDLLAELENQKAALASLQNKLLEENVVLQDQLNAAEAEIGTLKTENLKLKDLNPEINPENMELLLSELQRLETQVNTYEQKIGELEATIAKLNKENTELSSELKASVEKCSKQEETANELKLKHKRQADVLAIAEKTAEERAEEIAKLEDLITQLSLNDTVEYNRPENDGNLDLDLQEPELEPAQATETVAEPISGPISEPISEPVKEPISEPEKATVPPSKSQVLDPFDPAAGRDNWCGLCERSGHTSVDCPYDD